MVTPQPYPGNLDRGQFRRGSNVGDASGAPRKATASASVNAARRTMPRRRCLFGFIARRLRYVFARVKPPFSARCCSRRTPFVFAHSFQRSASCIRRRRSRGLLGNGFAEVMLRRSAVVAAPPKLPSRLWPRYVPRRANRCVRNRRSRCSARRRSSPSSAAGRSRARTRGEHDAWRPPRWPVISIASS